MSNNNNNKIREIIKIVDECFNNILEPKDKAMVGIEYAKLLKYLETRIPCDIGKESIKEDKAKDNTVAVEPKDGDEDENEVTEDEVTEDEVFEETEETEDETEEQVEQEIEQSFKDHALKTIIDKVGYNKEKANQVVDMLLEYEEIAENDEEAMYLLLDSYIELKTECFMDADNIDENIICLTYYLLVLSSEDNGKEEIANIVSSLSDSKYDNMFEFVNKNNIDFVIDNIYSNYFDDEDEQEYEKYEG